MPTRPMPQLTNRAASAPAEPGVALKPQNTPPAKKTRPTRASSNSGTILPESGAVSSGNAGSKLDTTASGRVSTATGGSAVAVMGAGFSGSGGSAGAGSATGGGASAGGDSG